MFGQDDVSRNMSSLKDWISAFISKGTLSLFYRVENSEYRKYQNNLSLIFQGCDNYYSDVFKTLNHKEDLLIIKNTLSTLLDTARNQIGAVIKDEKSNPQQAVGAILRYLTLWNYIAPILNRQRSWKDSLFSKPHQTDSFDTQVVEHWRIIEGVTKEFYEQNEQMLRDDQQFQASCLSLATSLKNGKNPSFALNQIVLGVSPYPSESDSAKIALTAPHSIITQHSISNFYIQTIVHSNETHPIAISDFVNRYNITRPAKDSKKSAEQWEQPPAYTTGNSASSSSSTQNTLRANGGGASSSSSTSSRSTTAFDSTLNNAGANNDTMAVSRGNGSDNGNMTLSEVDSRNNSEVKGGKQSKFN